MFTEFILSQLIIDLMILLSIWMLYLATKKEFGYLKSDVDNQLDDLKFKTTDMDQLCEHFYTHKHVKVMEEVPTTTTEFKEFEKIKYD